MRTNEARRVIGWLMAAGLVSQCGGGGIGGSGSVSGFGSVFVNGIEWFTESAVVTLDGVAGSESDLRLGMVVEVRGLPLPDDATAEALSVEFDDAIQGPVEAIAETSPTSRTLQVLGQTVILDADDTRFDDSDPGSGFQLHSVAVGDVLEVSGLLDGAAAIHATWVRRLGSLALGVTPVELEGVVSGWSEGEGFELGAVAVEFGPGTDLSELAGALADGLPVEVEGVLVEPALVLADRVGPSQAPPREIAGFSLEGIVSGFASLADFRVAGQPVDASAASFLPADPSFVSDGARVEVEGPIVDGVLIAEEVQLEAPETAD
jgi:hypothetical protein